MNYKIDKNIPMPEGHELSTRNQVAGQMEVGDSMLIEDISKVVAVRTFLKKKDRTIAMRKQTNGTYRIWRLT